MQSTNIETKEESSLYCLQDSRGLVGDNLMFWASSGGYTSNFEEAEHFTEEAAFSQHQSRETDIPWPVAYLRNHTRPVVDMQYIRQADGLGEPSSEENLCVQVPGYVGNDILFIAKEGGFSTNLEKAAIFNVDTLNNIKDITRNTKATIWRKAYLGQKSRNAVDVATVNLSEALGSRTQNLKRSKKLVPRYRCHSCGIFLSAVSYYSSQCRCGADNRP